MPSFRVQGLGITGFANDSEKPTSSQKKQKNVDITHIKVFQNDFGDGWFETIPRKTIEAVACKLVILKLLSKEQELCNTICLEERCDGFYQKQSNILFFYFGNET